MKGFTLIELAIVIVIMGVIVIGVFSGRSLIEGASLTKHMSQVKELEGALNTFTLQYNASPGDFNNATTYFGTNILNGNGDGLINYSTFETLNAFRMLNISGIYRHTTITAANNFSGIPVPGTHLPECRALPGCMLAVANAGLQKATAIGANPRPRQNAIIMEGIKHNGTTQSPGFKHGILTPAQANEIDTKMDDGIAVAGKVRAYSDRMLCGAGHNEYIDCAGNYPSAGFDTDNVT